MKYWPSGDDTFSRATRLKTMLALLWAGTFIAVGGALITAFRRACGC